jgi:4-coumarate--CoA ligase
MKIYHSHYPSVTSPDESIFTFLFQSPSPFPVNTPAFIDGASGRAITHPELKELALSLGWGLRNSFATLGGIPLARGDTVMILSPNTLAWPIILFGCVAAGLRVTTANSGYGPEELKYQYTNSGAGAIFVHPTLLDTVLAMFELISIDASEAKKRIIVADWNELSSETVYIRMCDLLGGQSLEEEEKFPGIHANETAYMCYSSGTTGLPKGVEVRSRTSQRSQQLCTMFHRRHTKM